MALAGRMSLFRSDKSFWKIRNLIFVYIVTSSLKNKTKISGKLVNLCSKISALAYFLYKSTI